MEQVAFVFPGQGSQYVGMGLSLAEASPAAMAVFREADAAVGSSISALAWHGPAEDLDRTVNAQPALLATSIAYLRAMEAEVADGGGAPIIPAFCAGHSMGQFSAMVAAGTLDFADAMRLVTERGRLMQASAPGSDGAMAAIIGLDPGALPEVLGAGAQAGLVVLANDNATGVDWSRTVRTMASAGVRRFVEVGPGRVLSGLVRRIVREAEMHALDDQSAPGRLALPEWALDDATRAGSAVA